jgi:hypothetical protein
MIMIINTAPKLDIQFLNAKNYKFSDSKYVYDYAWQLFGTELYTSGQDWAYSL